MLAGWLLALSVGGPPAGHQTQHWTPPPPPPPPLLLLLLL